MRTEARLGKTADLLLPLAVKTMNRPDFFAPDKPGKPAEKRSLLGPLRHGRGFSLQVEVLSAFAAERRLGKNRFLLPGSAVRTLHTDLAGAFLR